MAANKHVCLNSDPHIGQIVFVIYTIAMLDM